MTFKNLKLIPEILQSLEEQQYIEPTPIQKEAIPLLLQRRDVFGNAQTGTGKTAAFGLPLLQLLHEERDSQKGIRALVLAPTRELAVQISKSLHIYGCYLRLKHVVIHGGVPQRPQTELLRKGVDIVVATPGRLLDLVKQGYIKLGHIEIFVLDEADRMLDMGFINDIQKIIRLLPENRQTVLFSATLPQNVRNLVSRTLKNPLYLELNRENTSAENVLQSLYFVDKPKKGDLLRHLLKDPSVVTNALVFTRTKHGANKLSRILSRNGIRTEAIHGNKSQGARQKALNDFQKRKIRVLVATDVASRGIDVDDLSHVINFDLPQTPETYVHRIGRTGRAGAQGAALSFCTGEEMALLSQIHRHLDTSIPVVDEHPFPTSENLELPPTNPRRYKNIKGKFYRKRQSGRGKRSPGKPNVNRKRSYR